jgi:RNA polymerase sigma factor (sigma-70 family)
MDQALCARFVAGDSEAFETIFALMRREVAGVVRRFFRGAFDQEEAFQEVWLEIYRKRDRFDVNRFAELGGWVRTVARHRCIDLLQAAGVRPGVGNDDAAAIAGPDPEPRAGLDDEIRAAFDAFAAGLDEEEGRFFQLCFVEERPHEEVAVLLGINERRSKYLKKKLLQRLERDPALRCVRE